MLTAVSTDIMRRADAACIAAGTPAAVLMYRAGQAILESYDFSAGPTVILCGTGNNGGDGFVLALLLQEAGLSCRILLAEEKFSPDGRYYFEKCEEKGVPVFLWSETEWNVAIAGCSQIVDCLFGTGFHGTVREPYSSMIRRANGSGRPIVAVDIPSGVHGDSGLAAVDETGTPLCICAEVTVSIGTRKYGHFLAMAKDVCGRVVNRDIGIPISEQGVMVPEAGDFGDILPPRKYHSHKGTYGYVAVMGGCESYSGAVKLANRAAAALRSGCGVVKLICARSVLPAVMPHLLESTAVGIPDTDGFMHFDVPALEGALAGTAALAIGMGWGSGPENEKILTWILENYDRTLILDADGLNCLGRMDPEKRKRLLGSTLASVILTPHPKEFERISGIPMEACAGHPVDCAMAYARENGVVLLYKGTATVVTDGSVCYIVDRGCPGMATAGSGDVLAGVLAGLGGYNRAGVKMTACGAFLAGLAGEMAQAEMGQIGMTASDTVRYLAAAARQMQEIL